MLFALEAVFAKHGDALILHYGDPDAPGRILIDGGPSEVYAQYLKPQLNKIRKEEGLGKKDSLSFAMVMISHIDDDHINGILALFDEQADANEKGEALPYNIERLWHNSFDDTIALGDEAKAATIATLIAEGAGEIDQNTAVVASVGQGRDLRRLCKQLGMAKRLNSDFDGGLVMAPETGKKVVPIDGDLEITVLGPSQTRIEKYRERWKKDLAKILAKEKAAAEVASKKDYSPFNLASIVVLAELGDKRMLLTGDARGDYIEEGLVAAGFLGGDEDSFHVNLLKLPHHGSNRNVTPRFFERITADHYLISGDGHHGNPEVDTLQMLASARKEEAYTLHLTVPEEAHQAEDRPESKAALEKLSQWITNDCPENCTVAFRSVQENSVIINL